MTNAMPIFEVLRNRRFVGTVAAVSLKQAVKRAQARYGRCEVIGVNIARHADAIQWQDCNRTEGRAPCNNTESGKARIEAIRLKAIADYMAAQ